MILSCNWKTVLQCKQGGSARGAVFAPGLASWAVGNCAPAAPASSRDPQLFLEERLCRKGQDTLLKWSLGCKIVQGHLHPREGGPRQNELSRRPDADSGSVCIPKAALGQFPPRA